MSEGSKEKSRKDERYEAGRRATVLSVLVNVGLSLVKVFAGFVGNSAAMLADGIHSLSDLVTDGAVLVGMRVAQKDADEDHPYGHGKFETLATQFISVTLIAVAFGICMDAVDRIRAPGLGAPTPVALLAAILSIASKEALYQYTVRLGKRYDARALIANAWHHRSDAVSSIAALIGIGGAMMGWPILDPLAAIAVAFILGKIGVDLFREALHELTDSRHAIDQQIHERIQALVDEIAEVRSAHFLTPRRLGPDILVDVHVVVDRFLSVSEGHQIAEKVRNNLCENVDAIYDVLVHVDTEDDHLTRVPVLSSRESLRKKAESAIPDDGAIRGIRGITPHYSTDGIILDLVLDEAESFSTDEAHSSAKVIADRLLETNTDLLEVRISLASVLSTRATGRERRI